MKIKFKAQVVNKEIVYVSPLYVSHHLRKLEGKKVLVEIAEEKRKRSVNQNSYYWGVVVPLIAEEMGEDDEAYIHALMKFMFLKKTKEINGRVYEAVGSTKKLTTDKFNIFLEKVIRFASMELGMVIPEPDKTHNYAVLISE